MDELIPLWSCISKPSRTATPAIFLRESYRQNGKVHKRTLCNLSDWPTAYVEGLHGGSRAAPSSPRGATPSPSPVVCRTAMSPPPSATARKIGLDHRILGPYGGLHGGPDGNRCRDLALAMLISRILEHGHRFRSGPVVAFLQPGDIVDDRGGSGLDAAVIAVDRLVPADRGVLEFRGLLLGHKQLNILAQ